MIQYQHRYEARIGRVVLDAYDVIAHITAARDEHADWTVSKIEAEGIVEVLDGYGLPDYRNQWVTVPANSPLYDLILRDLYDTAKSDMDAAWEAGKMEKV